MKFTLEDSIEILRRTPSVLRSMLQGLNSPWIHNNDGPNTRSPHDIVGHLIHGELTDWIPRTKIILQSGESKTFPPFDRFAQEKASQGKNLNQLLAEFESLRKQNIVILTELKLDEQQLLLTGQHPDLGKVTLQELLSTWVVHDLSHINQISRVMARNYKNEVGPWKAYISIMNT